MVETYLATVAGGVDSLEVRDTPVLRAVRASLKKADLASYKKHLAAKYR